MSKCKGNILFTLIFGQKPTQSELRTNIQDVPEMVVRLSFILVFISGVAMAFLCSLLPDISTLMSLTSSFPRNGKSGFSYKLSADEKYGILGKGEMPNFHTSTLTIKKPQDLEIHPGKGLTLTKRLKHSAIRIVIYQHKGLPNPDTP